MKLNPVVIQHLSMRTTSCSFLLCGDHIFYPHTFLYVLDPGGLMERKVVASRFCPQEVNSAAPLKDKTC